MIICRSARRFGRAAFFFTCLLVANHGAEASAANYDLAPAPHRGNLVRVKTRVDVEGSLYVRSAKEKPARLPLKVHGELVFDQRALPGPGFHRLRHYWHTRADLEVNDKAHERTLRDDRQLIVLSDRPRQGRPQFSSPLGPLRREELDLIDVTGSGFSPESLLPSQPVESEATWEHADDVAAALLCIDAVQSGRLTSRLASVTDAVAKIELMGKIMGRVEAADTEIEVMGTYQFDRQARTVKWLAMSLKEKREASYVTPGFDVVALVRMVRQPIETSSFLTADALSSLDLPVTPSQLFLEFVSPDDRYRMVLDRRWHLVSEPGGAAVLRMVDSGDLLATCQVERLNRLPPGKQISLYSFQADVQRALASNCDQIMEAEETISSRGVRILRVVARGQAAQVAIHWIYYHLSCDDGQRLSYIFTHEAAVADRFAGQDEALTGTVEFLTRENQTAQQRHARRIPPVNR